MGIALHKPQTAEEKSTKTTVDTICFTASEARSWVTPEFQRPVRANANVIALAEVIKINGGVLPGVLTFGIYEGKRFLIDGQQRRESFLLSEMPDGYADIRNVFCDNYAQMASEYRQLNSRLVMMTPDDMLKGLEPQSSALTEIRKRCGWVGYDRVRHGDHSPLLSMSVLIRSWAASANDVPSISIGGMKIAETMTYENARLVVRFLGNAMAAWGRDPEYARLWSAVNLHLCMWLYRRTVLEGYSVKSARLDDDTFRYCLMGLSSDAAYLDWLVGRRMGERDRSPAYNRIKKVFAARILDKTGKKVLLPAPAWAHG